ncbi:MAG: ABC transporter ATP-binding protein [Chloroflexi bacterium]|nr:ABC transporter ATP-binding protein [Chloroflexota bacterium]
MTEHLNQNEKTSARSQPQSQGRRPEDRAQSDKHLNQDEILLEVKDLKKHFPIQRGFLKKTVGHVKAVDGVSFDIKKGETFGLVGESGCGKTTTGRCIVRLLESTSGEIVFNDDAAGRLHVEKLDKNQMRELRRHMQIVFQDPYSSLNPRLTLKRIVGEPLVVNGITDNGELTRRVADLLQAVGMPPDVMDRYPHALSGGQRQRIGIARALALNPRLIVCDEPVSALDVSVQAQVLNLLEDLQQDMNLTYLFVAHDLSVVKHISDRVAVMYVGKLAEMAETEALYTNPKHPYTEALMAAVPKPDPRARSRKLYSSTGEVANPANPPSGCYFHPRCRYAQEICTQKLPLLRDVGNEHWVACHRADELELVGLEMYE